GVRSYLLGLNKRIYEKAGVDTEENSTRSYKELGLDWMIDFLFGVSFIILLALISLIKLASSGNPFFTNIYVRNS
ncbi:UNVERIFIED_CONTAM: hypothetical protein Sindi_3045100, partial [Sesamum indicum]